LCFKEIEKDFERFLVQRKKGTLGFDVNVAPANLEFHVPVTSEYICRQCHGVLKKRSNLQQSLENLQKSMKINYATYLNEVQGACFSAENFARRREVQRGFDSKATAAHLRLEMNNPSTSLQ